MARVVECGASRIAAILASFTLILLAVFAGDVAAQTVSAEAVVQMYAKIVYASYEDSLSSAKVMRHSIDVFVAKPTGANLEVAKASWLAARDWYGQTEAFRFYGGPIDDVDGPEPRINSWPVDESYIDSVKGNQGAGIINDLSVPITKSRLAALNGNRGQENIATGWHAIEFLLWGQDFNDKGPGDRSFEDFVDGRKANAKRRREYLKVVTDLLIDDLEYLTNAWRPGADNYRSRLVAAPTEALRRMLVGIGSLSRGEMAGERLEVPLATQDQEDEQSCFSDNTHRDIIADATGIENVWLGRYRRADGTLLQGPSLNDLVAANDATVARRTTDAVATTVATARAIQPPFDQEIRGDSAAPGRLRVQATVDALKQQAMDFVASAGVLGITKLTIVRPKR